MERTHRTLRQLVESLQSPRRGALEPSQFISEQSRLRKGFDNGLGRLGDPRSGRAIRGLGGLGRHQSHRIPRNHGIRVERDQASPSEAAFDVYVRESLLEGSPERGEEVIFGDVRNIGPSKFRDLVAVRCLQRAKHADVERLGLVRRVRRQTERNNTVFFTVLAEFGVGVAPMAVQHQHPPLTLLTGPGVLVEVLEPFKAHIVVCPAGFGPF